MGKTKVGSTVLFEDQAMPKVTAAPPLSPQISPPGLQEAPTPPCGSATGSCHPFPGTRRGSFLVLFSASPPNGMTPEPCWWGFPRLRYREKSTWKGEGAGPECHTQYLACPQCRITPVASLRNHTDEWEHPPFCRSGCPLGSCTGIARPTSV